MKKNHKAQLNNPEREHRIFYEIIVDCYDEEEQKMGWYYYMEEKLHFPFEAQIILRKKNGTKTKQSVEVVQLSSDEEFGNDMTVEVCYDEIVLDIPLLQLLNIKADEASIQAIEDWRYWNSK